MVSWIAAESRGQACSPVIIVQPTMWAAHQLQHHLLPHQLALGLGHQHQIRVILCSQQALHGKGLLWTAAAGQLRQHREPACVPNCKLRVPTPACTAPMLPMLLQAHVWAPAAVRCKTAPCHCPSMLAVAIAVRLTWPAPAAGWPSAARRLTAVRGARPAGAAPAPGCRPAPAGPRLQLTGHPL